LPWLFEIETCPKFSSYKYLLFKSPTSTMIKNLIDFEY
jgi:hypothetical protein